MNKYEKNHNGDLSKTYKPYELVNISFEKIKNHSYVTQQTFGVVNAMGVKQTIRGVTVKHNDELFMENLSVSRLVQAANRFYQKDDLVTTYDGKNIQTESANWNESPTTSLTKKEHEEKWGKDLSRPYIYIISSQTCLETSNIVKTSDGYLVSVDLDPIYGALRYVKQMCNISHIDPPSFQSINIKYTLDNELNMLKSEVTESYTVVMGVKAKSDATMTEYFEYDKEIAIPDIKSNFTYVKGE